MDEDKQRYSGDDRRHHWRFERRFGLDTILAALAIIGAVYGFGNSILLELRANYVLLDKRVTILEEKSLSQKENDRRQDEVIRDGQQRVEAAIADMQRSLREMQRTPPRP